MPTPPKHRLRPLDIADDAWDAALAAAELRGGSVSDVVRRALDEYVAETNRISAGM